MNSGHFRIVAVPSTAQFICLNTLKKWQFQIFQGNFDHPTFYTLTKLMYLYTSSFLTFCIQGSGMVSVQNGLLHGYFIFLHRVCVVNILSHN